MKRFGIQWDKTRINGRDYVHVGLYVDPTVDVITGQIVR
jgi:uncharacterized protein (DUF736 family)